MIARFFNFSRTFALVFSSLFAFFSHFQIEWISMNRHITCAVFVAHQNPATTTQSCWYDCIYSPLSRSSCRIFQFLSNSSIEYIGIIVNSHTAVPGTVIRVHFHLKIECSKLWHRDTVKYNRYRVIESLQKQWNSCLESRTRFWIWKGQKTPLLTSAPSFFWSSSTSTQGVAPSFVLLYFWLWFQIFSSTFSFCFTSQS